MIHASIRDITDRRRTEDALRRNEALYRTLVESTSDIVWEVDRNGRYSYVSPVIRTVLGFEPDEVIGRTPFDLMPQNEAEGIRTVFSEYVTARRPIVRLENTNIHKDGHSVILETSGEPVFDKAGTLTGYRGIDRDITERRRTEEALEESEQKYRQLVDLAKEGIWTIDAGAVTSYVNPTMARMLGYTTDEMIGRHLFSFMDDREREIAANNVERRQQGVSEQHDFEFLKKDGSRIYTRLSTSPLTDAAGTYRGALAVVADITEQRKAEDALKETNKKLNLLSSITRHDVLNKLTALQGFIELSKECFSVDETFRSFADKELLAVSEIQRIISFTKEYEEIGVRSPEWQDIRDVLRKAAGWLDWGVIDLRIQVSGYMIYADPLLEKVFYNLLENSLRHGQTVTALQISVSETANGLVIVCQDNGTGITAGEKEKIFGRGYGGHSGFGLFLAREILGITGISIRETGQPGAGARFEILAPRDVYRAPG
jgi:PAS domain S-box-containing protein